MLDIKNKQPYEILDFDIECSRRLGDDEIAGASASYTGPDNTLVIERTSWADSRVKIVIGGGTNNERYKITAFITTMSGRVLESEFLLKIKDL